MRLLSSQFSKFEVVQNLYALLDSKKTYVRYISHELRYSGTSLPCSLPLFSFPCSCHVCCFALNIPCPPSRRRAISSLLLPYLLVYLNNFHPANPLTHCRTPMNTACLGLGMLLAQATQLSTRPTPEELERLETLTDINASCTTAVEILNDLLTFEVRVDILHLFTVDVALQYTLQGKLCIALRYTASHHTPS